MLHMCYWWGAKDKKQGQLLLYAAYLPFLKRHVLILPTQKNLAQ